MTETQTGTGTAREEAEKFVAALLAAATMAANAHPRVSTGSAECCVCPLCKVIAAVRDPNPEVVERVATGAGDLAAGMASFLRHVAAVATVPDADAPTAHVPSQPVRKPPKQAVKVVKKAVKKAVPKKAG